jgi:bifunctional UDP-N-acetylglucosamine pyrophosphorylase/glucosamine-1-phosphate N-acetyltransferase
MARILDRQSAANLLAASVTPSLWTVIIAAAGRGTRLDFDKPKILFPVGGVTILERLIRLWNPLCTEFLFVLSPDGKPVVEPEIDGLLGARGSVAIQPSPKGMGDAVSRGLAMVRTRNVAVVWGDQFALKPSSLDFSMRLLEGSGAEAVCPTVIRNNPYIHLQRDAADHVVRILQKREGDPMPTEGESDSGVFFFAAEALRRQLNGPQPEDVGATTNEWNFLPVLSRMDTSLITARIMSEQESVGVNTKEDAAYLEGRGDL